LKAECRWVVMGTPITNSLQDVFSLLKFLWHEPWCETGIWRAAIIGAMGNAESGSSGEAPNPGGMKVALDRVCRLLDPLLLRRTKDSQITMGKYPI
jgi:DNA repair protein RAD5